MESTIQIEIREKACRGCKFCVDTCPTDVFGFDEKENRAVVRQVLDCIGCMSCAYQCPSNAIHHEGVALVKIFYREERFISKLGRYL